MKAADANALEVLVSGERAGWLVKDGGGRLSFSYDAGYRGPDLSIRMPVSESVYQGRIVAAWFSNLLPDDMLVRRGMAAEAGTSTGVFPLLAHYGLDLPGAVQVISPESWDAALGQPQSYVRLSSEEIGERLRAMLTRRTTLSCIPRGAATCWLRCTTLRVLRLIWSGAAFIAWLCPSAARTGLAD